MKYLRSFLLFLSAAFIISSCQKELSFEDGAARGTLKKASGECMPASIAGSYKKDTLLTAANYVDIQVDITQTGTYIIKTDTLNGYSFSATGIVPVQGVNTIRLLASGRPVAAGLNMFTVKFDTTSCKINNIVTSTGGGSTVASYTLTGSPNACAGAVQSNNFFADLPTNASNYVDIKVDVTQPGTYGITTPVVNGVSFSAVGSLSVGTNQTIRLLANGGTPTAAGSTFNYPLTTTTPASNCGFILTVQAAPTPASFTFECPSNPTFFGTYQAGVSTAGNSVRINVISAAGGSYSITTSTTVSDNGVIFSGNGVLPASASPQSVTLYANAGPATAAGAFTYTLTGTGVTSTCTFDQTYSMAPVANGTITVKINGTTTAATFNVNAEGLLTSSMGFASMVISGDSTTAMNTSMVTLTMNKNGAINGPGTYTSTSTSNAGTIQYDDTAGTMFLGWIGGGSCTITITNITTVPPLRVQGTFSGVLKDNVGMGTNTTTFASGTFDVPYQ